MTEPSFVINNHTNSKWTGTDSKVANIELSDFNPVAVADDKGDLILPDYSNRGNLVGNINTIKTSSCTASTQSDGTCNVSYNTTLTIDSLDNNLHNVKVSLKNPVPSSQDLMTWDETKDMAKPYKAPPIVSALQVGYENLLGGTKWLLLPNKTNQPSYTISAPTATDKDNTSSSTLSLDDYNFQTVSIGRMIIADSTTYVIKSPVKKLRGEPVTPGQNDGPVIDGSAFVTSQGAMMNKVNSYTGWANSVPGWACTKQVCSSTLKLGPIKATGTAVLQRIGGSHPMATSPPSVIYTNADTMKKSSEYNSKFAPQFPSSLIIARTMQTTYGGYSKFPRTTFLPATHETFNITQDSGNGLILAKNYSPTSNIKSITTTTIDLELSNLKKDDDIDTYLSPVFILTETATKKQVTWVYAPGHSKEEPVNGSDPGTTQFVNLIKNSSTTSTILEKIVNYSGLPAPLDRIPDGYTIDSVLSHNHGHIVVNMAEDTGADPVDIVFHFVAKNSGPAWGHYTSEGWNYVIKFQSDNHKIDDKGYNKGIWTLYNALDYKDPSDFTGPTGPEFNPKTNGIGTVMIESPETWNYISPVSKISITGTTPTTIDNITWPDLNEKPFTVKQVCMNEKHSYS